MTVVPVEPERSTLPVSLVHTLMTAYEAVILDVDGTIVRGDDLISGADEGIRRIDATESSRLLFSNNPTRGSVHYGDRLGAHGIAVDPELVLTCATVTAEYLSTHHIEDALYLLGEDRLETILERAGLSVTREPAAADVVLGSIDREFTYEKLRQALVALEREVPFYGTDPDVTIPAATGTVPGSGAMLAAMAAVSGRDPDAILGKPSAIAAKAAMDRLETTPERTLIVGDRLNTDIAMGNQAGMDTAVVLTGVTSQDDLDSRSENVLQPDFVLDSLGDVGQLLE